MTKLSVDKPTMKTLVNSARNSQQRDDGCDSFSPISPQSDLPQSAVSRNQQQMERIRSILQETIDLLDAWEVEEDDW
jgi:hypothetical protein